MTDSPEAAAARPVRGSRAYLVLGALAVGLLSGALAHQAPGGWGAPSLQFATLVGGLWLDALKMTVVPLIVTLLVTGIAKGAEAAQGGRIAARTTAWIVAISTVSAVVGTILISLFVAAFPLSGTAARALQSGLAAIDPSALSAPVPRFADFFQGIVPSNIVAAAADGQILALVVFSLLFALAVTRIGSAGRRSILTFFEAVSDALLIIVGWVLWLAPAGVLALGFALAAGAGGAAFAGLAHYIVLVSAVGIVIALAAYPLAILAGRVPAGRFARAMVPPQAVAISTRSSLASLPAMLASARIIGVREEVSDISLPMSVALFRATGPAMNAAVVLYVAHWLGFEPGPWNLIAMVAVAAVASYASVSLPGEISFITSTAPIAMALGVPIAPLALFVAVEMIPDIFRTFGNVTMDVAVTSAVDRSNRGKVPKS